MTTPSTIRPAALGDGWHPCDDPDTCPRQHWLAVGYREGTLTAVALHEPPAPRAPAPRERTP